MISALILPIAISKEIKAMSGSSAFSPVTHVLIAIGKRHFTLAVSAALNILSHVASAIGLHHIPRTMPSVILVIPAIDIAVAINRDALALSPAFEPVTREAGIDSTRFQTLEGAITVWVGSWVSLLAQLPVWSPNEGYLSCVEASLT